MEETYTISRSDLLRLDFLAQLAVTIMSGGISVIGAQTAARLTPYSVESLVEATNTSHDILGFGEELTTDQILAGVLLKAVG